MKLLFYKESIGNLKIFVTLNFYIDFLKKTLNFYIDFLKKRYNFKTTGNITLV